jgi:uncharacterized spore protein YtfJ
MPQLSDVILWQTVTGEPFESAGAVITPLTHVLAIRLPLGPAAGGFVWNRPVALLVERDGEVERVPILDVTRMAQVGLLLTLVVVGLLSRRQRERKKDE